MGQTVKDLVENFYHDTGVLGFAVKIQSGHIVKALCGTEAINEEFTYSYYFVSYWFYNPEKHILTIFI